MCVYSSVFSTKHHYIVKAPFPLFSLVRQCKYECECECECITDQIYNSTKIRVTCLLLISSYLCMHFVYSPVISPTFFHFIFFFFFFAKLNVQLIIYHFKLLQIAQNMFFNEFFHWIVFAIFSLTIFFGLSENIQINCEHFQF